MAINSGVGTSVVHGMSILVRVQTPEPIQSSTRLYFPVFKDTFLCECYSEL